MEAFALTGRNYHLYIIYPRVLPWDRSFCPFRAYGAYLRNLVNNLKASKNEYIGFNFCRVLNCSIGLSCMALYSLGKEVV